jgi:hypothetical protein
MKQRKAEIATKFDLMALAPTNDLMLAAWVDCLSWAISHKPAMTAFRAETGINWTPARSPIEQMIDKATGAEVHFMEQFARWVNRTIWGEVDGRASNGDEPDGTDERPGGGDAE